MANINRDYIVIVDVKKSSISLANGSMIFNTLDRNTSNIFVNLVINTSNNPLINRYANIENAEDYAVSMNIVKPNNECLTLEAVLHDRDSALFEIELPTRATDVVGNYSCELLTKCTINGRQEVTTSNVISYVVQKSVFTDVSGEVLESEKYPIVMEMFDKLSDIERYEEDRRQAEVIRQVSEIERVSYFNSMTSGMQDEFNDLMDVMTEQVERIEERYANTDFGIFHARFEAVEEVNNIQNERLRNIENVNKNQDVNIACLFADSNTQRATIEVEGNNTPLLNSKDGFALVHDIEGRTMVNLNKDVDKSLTLNGIINLEGQDIMTTQGVDGGLVDVYLEGNTMVNLCDQQDSVPLTMSYTVETGNHVVFQGDLDGKAKPYVYGNTLWIDNDTEEVLTEFDETKDLRLQSSFEDQLVTEGEHVGKYKVDYVSTGKNLFNPNDLIVDGSTDINSGVGFDIVNNEIILNGTSTDYFDFRPISGTWNAKLTNYIEQSPVGTKLVLSNNCGYNNYWSVRRNGSFYFPLNTLTKQEGDTEISCFVRIPEGEVLDGKILNIQIEEGSTATAYEPFRQTTKTLYLNSPLLEGDSIEVQGNNIVHVHRYNKIVLDGSESWGKTGISNWANQVFGCEEYFNRIADNNSAGLVQTNLFADKLPTVTMNGLVNDGNYGIATWNLSDSNSIFMNIQGIEDVASLQTYLQENPITVIYQLETPTYELISSNDDLYIDSYVGGHLDFDSAVPIEAVAFKPVYIDLKYQKNSTDYTIQFEADNDGIINQTYFGGTNNPVKNDVIVKKGLNKITLGVGTGELYNAISIQGIGCNISNIVVTEATDLDFGYFQGMKSVGELEELRVMSSNSDNSQSSSKQLTHEPLRGVGDVKDKYVLIDGEWYIERLFNQVALDGGSDENWGPFDTAYDNVVAFLISLSNEPKSKGVCISSNFLYKFANEDSEHFYTGGELVIFINKSKLSTPDVNGFKTWLSQNPTTVVYQLATPTYEKIDYNPLPVYLDMTYITTNSTIPANLKVKNHGFNALLKPSTTYTIASNQGTQTFATGAEIDDSLRLYGEGTMNDVRVFEGAVTDIPSHFSGIESAFEQHYDEEVGKYKVEIETTGENLFDLNKLNLSVQGEGLIIDGSKIKLTRKNIPGGFFAYCTIKLKPNTTYTFSCNNPYGQGVFYCYTDNLHGNRLFTAQSNKIFTTINQTDYIVGLYMGSAENEVEWTDIQIEEGNTATAYEPYKSSTISFYLDEPLRGMGDVRDRIFIQDGEVKVERKIGKTVLDGSADEEWISMANNSHGISNFRTLIPGIKAFSNDTVISDKYTVDTSLQAAAIREGILISEGTSFYLRKRTAIAGGVEQLRLYLQSNPATIIYELATPTVEVIDGVGGRLAVEIYENGHLSFNTNIPVSSELEYTVSVPVLENVAEVASITDEQDMLIVDMATQLAIMNLTL